MKEEWKVYIKGVTDRGNEVIKTLTDLGANNDYSYDDYTSSHFIYFINHEGNISSASINSEPAKIIMDNYRELHLPEKWKDGDVLIANNGTCYKVFWEYDSDIAFYAYNMSMQIDGTLTRYSGSIWHGEKIQCFREDYRLATPSEVERFHDLLHKHKKEWDAEKQQLVDWRWKPKSKENYYYISSFGKTLMTTYLGTNVDRESCKIGNCFRTQKEAEAMAEKVKKLLKGE